MILNLINAKEYTFLDYCRYLIGKQGVVIALTTALLYLMAQSYLRSFLSFFGASSHWFDTSLPRLVSFTFSGVGVALLFVVFYCILQVMEYRYRSRWIIAYIAWCVAIVVLAFMYAAARIVSYSGAFYTNIIIASIGVAAWIAIPLISYRRSTKFVEISQHLPELEQQLKRSRAAKMLSVEMPHELCESSVLNAVSVAKDLGTPWLFTRKSVLSWVLMSVAYLWQMWYLAGVCGLIGAMMIKVEIGRIDRSAMGQILAERMIFTDGNYALVSRWVEGERRYYMLPAGSDGLSIQVKPKGLVSIETKLLDLDRRASDLEDLARKLEELSGRAADQ